jgi:hypothetical protein
MGQVSRWRNHLYHEPTNNEIKNVISRAFMYQHPRCILPKATIHHGHFLVAGLRKYTYERVSQLLQTLHPENLLNLEYIHSRTLPRRKYLAVSNIHPLGHCLAKCLADSFARQINEASEHFSRTGMGNSTEPISWAHGTESWYSPSDPARGSDDCIYHPENQVRIISRSFMPSIVIYVVPRTEIRHTLDKCATLVRYNLGVTIVVVISIDQAHRHAVKEAGVTDNNSEHRAYLPSLPCSEDNSVRHGDKIFITVLKMVDQGNCCSLSLPINNVEIFPNPTDRRLKAKFEDLALAPWSFQSEEPEFCLGFDDLTAHLYQRRTALAKSKEKWIKGSDKRER